MTPRHFVWFILSVNQLPRPRREERLSDGVAVEAIEHNVTYRLDSRSSCDSKLSQDDVDDDVIVDTAIETESSRPRAFLFRQVLIRRSASW